MPRFVIAEYNEAQGVVQRVLEASTPEEALRMYFDNYVTSFSKNDEGFTYFKEDFFDKNCPFGSIIEV